MSIKVGIISKIVLILEKDVLLENLGEITLSVIHNTQNRRYIFVKNAILISNRSVAIIK